MGYTLKRTGFTNAGYADINAAYGIPGSKICYTGLGKSEDALESADTLGSTRPINAIGIYCWNGRVVLGDSI